MSEMRDFLRKRNGRARADLAHAGAVRRLGRVWRAKAPPMPLTFTFIGSIRILARRAGTAATGRSSSSRWRPIPLGDPLATYAMLRVPGKPFVVSRVQFGPAQRLRRRIAADGGNDGGSHQDWAGVWVFDYHSTGDWNQQQLTKVSFSIDAQPLKMATAALGGADFPARRCSHGDHADDAVSAQKPSNGAKSPTRPPGLRWGHISKRGMRRARRRWRLSPAKWRRCWAPAFSPRPRARDWKIPGAGFPIPGKSRATASAGWFKLDAPRAKAWAGPSSGQILKAGELSASFPASYLRAVVNRFAGQHGRHAGGRFAPHDAGSCWQSRKYQHGVERRAQQRRGGLGQRPDLHQRARRQLETAHQRRCDLRVYALDESGQRRALNSLRLCKGGALKFRTSSADKTAWYEIVAP